MRIFFYKIPGIQPNRRQTNIQTGNDPVWWCLYASPGFNGFTHTCDLAPLVSYHRCVSDLGLIMSQVWDKKYSVLRPFLFCTWSIVMTYLHRWINAYFEIVCPHRTKCTLMNIFKGCNFKAQPVSIETAKVPSAENVGAFYLIFQNNTRETTDWWNSNHIWTRLMKDVYTAYIFYSFWYLFI